MYIEKLAYHLEKLGAFNWEEEEDRRAYNNAANDPNISNIDEKYLRKLKRERNLGVLGGALGIAGGIRHNMLSKAPGLSLKGIAKNKALAAGSIGLGLLSTYLAGKNNSKAKKYEESPDYRRFTNIGNKLDYLGVGTRGRDREDSRQNKQQVANLAAAGLLAHGISNSGKKD